MHAPTAAIQSRPSQPSKSSATKQRRSRQCPAVARAFELCFDHRGAARRAPGTFCVYACMHVCMHTHLCVQTIYVYVCTLCIHTHVSCINTYVCMYFHIRRLPTDVTKLWEKMVNMAPWSLWLVNAYVWMHTIYMYICTLCTHTYVWCIHKYIRYWRLICHTHCRFINHDARVWQCFHHDVRVWQYCQSACKMP
jgi:hypothetical protein